MQIKAKNILSVILFLFVVILVILMFSTPGYVPYSYTNSFHKYARYEGFDQTGELDEDKKNKENMPPVEESYTSGDNLNGNTTVEGNTVSTPSSILASLGLFQNPQKDAFSGLLPLGNSSYNPANNNVIDKFSQVSDKSVGSDLNCYSAGLSNSKGPICLTPELIELLKSRGGNM